MNQYVYRQLRYKTPISMLVIISPAKNLRSTDQSMAGSQPPRFLDQSEKLIGKLRRQSRKKLQALMKISPKLAEENYQRYQDFNPIHTSENSKAAIYTFNGDVYQGMEIDTFTKPQIKYTQDHLRILSGLYGLLKPNDLIQPYRLEMGTSIAVGRKKNLYAFWKDTLTEQLNQDIKDSGDKILLNLASDEYWKAIDSSKLDVDIIKANFKEFRNGKYMFLSYDAKRARGMMTKYVLQNKVTTIAQLKKFNTNGYVYNPELSEGNQLIFTK